MVVTAYKLPRETTEVLNISRIDYSPIDCSPKQHTVADPTWKRVI